MKRATKEDILSLLVRSEGTALSGEKLAQHFGVSRTIISRLIKELKNDGFSIDAATKTGYTLHIENAPLNRELISFYMRNTADIYVYDTISSTQEKIRECLLTSKEPLVLCVANEQTEGHGRKQRCFYSPKDGGIYMSIALKSSIDAENVLRITSIAAVGVLRAIRECFSINAGIKWVNDIYLDGKKIAGILTRAITDCDTGKITSAVIGLGINYTTQDFPPVIRQKAGALFNGDPPLNRNIFIAKIVDCLVDAFKDNEEALLNEYKLYSCVLGHNIDIIYEDRTIRGKALDIDSSASLIVQLENGDILKLSTEEISIRPYAVQ